ncbi:MAG: cell division protein FtsX [Methylocystis sp.]
MAPPPLLAALLARAGALRKQKGAAEEDAPAFRSPLVPTDSVAGRSLVIVIAIMTFLAALAAGAALLVSQASVEWRAEASSEASLQLRPTPGRDMEADLKKAAEILRNTPGVRDAQIYTKAESEALLSPWLGEGLDLSELPTPRIIVVKLDPKQRPDLLILRADLAEAVPSAVLDDHHLFLERLGDMARAAVAVSALIFILIVGAMGIAVASATRAAVATNREIVEVLHIVGAADTFIAREFQRRFLALGLRGAAIGGGAAIAFLLLARILTRSWRATAGAEQLEAMFGDFSIGPEGFVIILMLAGGIALVTGYLSQAIVLRHLRRLG